MKYFNFDSAEFQYISCIDCFGKKIKEILQEFVIYVLNVLMSHKNSNFL